MSDIKVHNTRASLGKIIILFKIDLSAFGEPDIFLYKGDHGAPDIMFGGQPYKSWNVKTAGFKVSGKGRLPTPTFAMGDRDASMSAYIALHDFFRGAVLSRIKTYGKYLDGQPGADSTETQPPEMYQLMRIESQKDDMVQWRMESFLANSGKKVPARIIENNYCPFDYREHNGVGFDNSTSDKACPYIGVLYFDESDGAVTASQDSCGKMYSSCRKRHPLPGDVIPFGGFVGAGGL